VCSLQQCRWLTRNKATKRRQKGDKKATKRRQKGDKQGDKKASESDIDRVSHNFGCHGFHLVEVDRDGDDDVANLLLRVVFGDFFGVRQDHSDQLLNGEPGVNVKIFEVFSPKKMKKKLMLFTLNKVI
jgi:hypothetical protein